MHYPQQTVTKSKTCIKDNKTTQHDIAIDTSYMTDACIVKKDEINLTHSTCNNDV